MGPVLSCVTLTALAEEIHRQHTFVRIPRKQFGWDRVEYVQKCLLGKHGAIVEMGCNGPESQTGSLHSAPKDTLVIEETQGSPEEKRSRNINVWVCMRYHRANGKCQTGYRAAGNVKFNIPQFTNLK